MRVLRIILIVVYALTWFTFGCIYQNMAIKSSGKDFVFQEDIALKWKISQIKTILNFSGRDEAIEKLITSNDAKKIYIDFKVDEMSYPFVTEIPFIPNNSIPIDPLMVNIGYNWAIYYEEYFMAKGITHFKIECLEGFDLFKPYYKTKLSLYRGETDLPPTIEDILYEPQNVQLIENYFIWLPFGMTYSIGEYSLIFYLPSKLQYSANFLDNSIHIFKKVLSGEYQYPLLDFLYFSAVTITTLGYGDILPNSTKIRLCVMIESVIGIGLMGAFITSLFIKRSKELAKAKRTFLHTHKPKRIYKDFT